MPLAGILLVAFARPALNHLAHWNLHHRERVPMAGAVMIRIEVYSKRDRCLCEDVKATLRGVRREASKERMPLVVIDGRRRSSTASTRDLRRRLAARALADRLVYFGRRRVANPSGRWR